MQGLSGFRQGHDGLHWCGTIKIQYVPPEITRSRHRLREVEHLLANWRFHVVLTNLGEKMSDDEVDELLKAVDTSSGEINYTDLVRTILAN